MTETTVAPGQPLYEVSGLTRVFARGSVRALDGVSLQVRPGQRLGIVGESGSGKSTLIRLMAALDRPTAGSVRFRGQEITGLGEARLGFLRASVQLVFQDPRLVVEPADDDRFDHHRTAAVPAPSAGARRRRPPGSGCGDVLAAVDLPPEAVGRYPHEFSGGQRQRIAIARALAPDPEVLIADEPVSALDVSVRAQVLNLLSDLVAARGLTLIFVSHDLAVVRHLCDSVVVMRAGRIEEQGSAEQVFAKPSSDYTKALWAAVPRIKV